MYQNVSETGQQSMCSECDGQGYVIKECPRCGGGGDDPFFTCMSVPCVDCGGERQLFFLCSHIQRYSQFPIAH